MISHYKSSLISLFAKAQELNSNPKNAKLCLEIQETLIIRITYIERKIRVLKSEIKNNKKRLGTVDPVVRLNKTEARELKDAIEHYKHLIEQYNYLLVIFRYIGDAIAFTYIDKWDIKPMAFKESAGYLSGKKGARLERKILRESFSMGVIAILNDLTNCIRYGDITVPRDGKVRILIEAKSGRKGRIDDRYERQREQAKNIINYLDTDQTQSLYGKEQTYLRVPLQSDEKKHIDKLNEIVRDALKNGVSYAEVEEGVFYYASTKFDETSIKILKSLIKKCEHQHIIEVLNTMNKAAYYPLTLSIHNPIALYEFYKDQLTILIMVNCNVIRQKCLDRGFDVEFLTDKNCMFKFKHPKYAEYIEDGVNISQHYFGRVFAEFLSLDWFLNEMMTNMLNFDPSFVTIEKDNPDD